MCRSLFPFSRAAGGLAWTLMALAVLTACARPDDAWQRVLESGILRVGMDASFPPFEFVAADGALTGFDVELARELARRLEVEVEFVANLPYDGLYDALAVGWVDVVISALVVNPARMGDVAYSAPYFDAGQVLVMAGGADGGTSTVQGMADLGGRVLAVELGTRGDLEARRWARRLLDLTLIHCQTADDALAAVRSGQADAALVDHVSALDGIGMTDEPGLGIVGEPVVEEPYAVAVHRQGWQLLQAINHALSEMERDGTLDRMRGEWLREER
ncbi:MAG TPA: amino acid ABC transporter substrate-binding protein [Chloroflexi bacterium]|nr:amino acid ABC transporter substrate-binding protein [Chloroflexota bacterium]